MNPLLKELLEQFATENNVTDKGGLSVVLTLSRRWRSVELPVKQEDIESPKRGQVKGLGGPNVVRILKDHGIQRTLASEGGRTSRGSLQLARSYADFLRVLLENETIPPGGVPHEVEFWWIERIKEYFNREGFPIQVDPSLTISAIVREILVNAAERQRQMAGTMVRGIVLEHLVGAKLELALGGSQVVHKSVSTADGSSGASGDFEIGRSVLHVTTSPGDALIKKCRANIENGLRPFIICPSDAITFANGLVGMEKMAHRIEIFCAEDFISMNINELAVFGTTDLSNKTLEFIDKYNEIIDAVEKDASLKIVRTKN